MCTHAFFGDSLIFILLIVLVFMHPPPPTVRENELYYSPQDCVLYTSSSHLVLSHTFLVAKKVGLPLLYFILHEDNDC